MSLTVSNISSLVIDDLCDRPCEEEIATAMFYCDFRDRQEQTTTNIVGASLKQLLIRGEVLEHVQMAFQKAKREVGGRDLRLTDMVQMLKQAVAILPQVFICIDALDEWPPKHVLELLRSINDIFRGHRRHEYFSLGGLRLRPKLQDLSSLGLQYGSFRRGMT